MLAVELKLIPEALENQKGWKNHYFTLSAYNLAANLLMAVNFPLIIFTLNEAMGLLDSVLSRGPEHGTIVLAQILLHTSLNYSTSQKHATSLSGI